MADRQDYSAPSPKLRQFRARNGIGPRPTWHWLGLIVSLAVGLSWIASSSQRTHPHRSDWPISARARDDHHRVVLETLNGPPESFRSALLPEVKYITAGTAHGNSNQVLSTLKLLYLSIVLDRVPILPSLSGSAHHEGAPTPLSTFYNLSHLSQALSKPILEWREVQEAEIDFLPDLGCWRTVPRGGGATTLREQGVEPHFWPVPEEMGAPSYAKLEVFAQDKRAMENAIAEEWARHEHKEEEHDEGEEKEEDESSDQPTHEPDSHLLCFDQLLRTWEARFVNGEKRREALQDLDPQGAAWLEVGQHLHWNEHTIELADELLLHTLGSTGPYIGVHLRQGDFIAQRKAQKGVIEPFVTAVEEMRARLEEERGKRWHDLPVVFATDSDDADFILSLEDLGWHWIDHGKWETDERLGGWYAAHLDLAILSGASGFVGSKYSSFSSLTARRVESWQGGPTVQVSTPDRPVEPGVRKSGHHPTRLLGKKKP